MKTKVLHINKINNKVINETETEFEKGTLKSVVLELAKKNFLSSDWLGSEQEKEGIIYFVVENKNINDVFICPLRKYK